MNMLKWCIDSSFTTHKDKKWQPKLTCQWVDIEARLSVCRRHRRSTPGGRLRVLDSRTIWQDTANVVDEVLVGGTGIKKTESILYQDSKSTVLLENNGKMSSSSWKNHINVQDYFIKYWIKKGDVSVNNCPTVQKKCCGPLHQAALRKPVHKVQSGDHEHSRRHRRFWFWMGRV